jgi:phosphopantothenoylcysteine decarboxylase/phosphopantothenate--cysteine ligase
VKPLRILIASGPTREPIDPVRYLSNYSTGVMGAHLAAAAKKRGHRVTWIRCPDDAETAQDLRRTLARILPRHDVLMMAAAVCDARPARVAKAKIKKSALQSLKLVKNSDILADLARCKRSDQIFVGFALESDRVRVHAAEKLRQKKLEVILAQKVMGDGKPFGEGRIDATILRKDGSAIPLSRVQKRRIAGLLVREAERAILERKSENKR